MHPYPLCKWFNFSQIGQKVLEQAQQQKHSIDLTTIKEDFKEDSRKKQWLHQNPLTTSKEAPAKKTMASPKTFDNLEGDFLNKELFVRLIHFWEVRNFRKGDILMGVQLLLIDSKSTTIEGFISTHFLPRFKYELKPNTINMFNIRPSKSVYRVSPHKHEISFTSKTTSADVHEGDYQIVSQQFLLQDLQVFTDIFDKHTYIFDILGLLRVINEDNLDTPTPMATAPAPADARSKDMVFLHVQLEEYLNCLEFPCLPKHKLVLKVGIPVMLLRNINQKEGLCNGTRLIVTHMAERAIEYEIVTGTHVGRKRLRDWSG
ncbi:hypothetical protein N665_0172s0087 [Sinapis alba]|nr:hypothetical protein N665_0172s0087 [Sinapis alba]